MKHTKSERYFQGAYVHWWLFEMFDKNIISLPHIWLWLNINSFQEHGRKCWLTNETLGARAKVKQRKAQYCIKDMIDLGLLQRTEEVIKGENKRVLSCKVPPEYNGGGVHGGARGGSTGVLGGVARGCYISNTEDEEENMSPPANAGVATVTPKKKLSKKWLRIAQTLCRAVNALGDVKHDGQVPAWAKAIEPLHRVKKVPIPKIREAMEWYCSQLPARRHDRYFLVIRSGKTFFDKFGRLQEIMIEEQIASGEVDPPDENVEDADEEMHEVSPGVFKNRSGSKTVSGEISDEDFERMREENDRIG